MNILWIYFLNDYSKLSLLFWVFFLWRGVGGKERMGTVCPPRFKEAIPVVYRFPISKQFMGYFFDQMAFSGPTLSKNEQGMSFFCFVQNQLKPNRGCRVRIERILTTTSYCQLQSSHFLKFRVLWKQKLT